MQVCEREGNATTRRAPRATRGKGDWTAGYRCLICRRVSQGVELVDLVAVAVAHLFRPLLFAVLAAVIAYAIFTNNLAAGPLQIISFPEDATALDFELVEAAFAGEASSEFTCYLIRLEIDMGVTRFA